MTENKPMIVAIDGPAGSGKSTVARQVAAKTGFTFVDSGAIYRTVTWWGIQHGVSPEEEPRLTELFLPRGITLDSDGDRFLVCYDGRPVGEEIRTPEVSRQVALYSPRPGIRAGVNQLLRGFGSRRDLVMDGRDIGTVVFPDAALKVFLTASAEERARRRCEEFRSRGMPADFDAVLADVRERDHRDETRDVAPLKAADDAVVLDTTEMTIAQVTAAVLKLVEERRC